ncbi:dual specificity mitogen-activated protein kinase kinase 7-like [Sinocyclocheilus grahami]|uniref:dual specificity mitogen-activated protein kinase kinase 7-like n=1 Tax=Sinocyclocheilus grahami TaxID=75366 RepID=UPI0007AC830D|nr:PREDICTED: dual specificity mitogen-activated protein kinase kinase 7-like [Sinocyclocheilus grahami]
MERHFCSVMTRTRVANLSVLCECAGPVNTVMEEEESLKTVCVWAFSNECVCIFSPLYLVIVIQLSPAPAPSQRAALQLPLANDGGSRSSSSESSPQHPSYPSRPRQMLTLPTPTYSLQKSLENAEIDQKLQEIMKQTGYLKIDGQRYPAEVTDLISEGEIGSGTCGQVFKVRFKKTGHVIAVKQMRRTGLHFVEPALVYLDYFADQHSVNVELATGQFPYKNCKTDFEVLTKVLQEDPPVLPLSMGFSPDFQSFVKDCLTKDHRKRPKYHKLLEHSFIRRYEVSEVDVAGWFQTVMERTESPRSSQCFSHHQLHSLFSR